MQTVATVRGYNAAGVAEELRREYGLLAPRACGGRRAGLIIAVEGIDGAGLTTISRGLVEVLGMLLDAPVAYEKEPTGSPIGTLIREILSGRHRGLEHPAILAHLFAADRAYHLIAARLLERVSNGWIAILDRYKYSSAVYQGGWWLNSPYTPREVLELVNSLAPPANAIIYLDVEPRVAMERILSSRGRLEAPESIETLESLRRGYRALLSTLDENPEWPGEGKPWERLLRGKGLDPGCFYGRRAPHAIIVEAGGPPGEVLREAAWRLVERLVREGLLVATR